MTSARESPRRVVLSLAEPGRSLRPRSEPHLRLLACVLYTYRNTLSRCLPSVRRRRFRGRRAISGRRAHAADNVSVPAPHRTRSDPGAEALRMPEPLSRPALSTPFSLTTCFHLAISQTQPPAGPSLTHSFICPPPPHPPLSASFRVAGVSRRKSMALSRSLTSRRYSQKRLISLLSTR